MKNKQVSEQQEVIILTCLVFSHTEQYMSGSYSLFFGGQRTNHYSISLCPENIPNSGIIQMFEPVLNLIVLTKGKEQIIIPSLCALKIYQILEYSKCSNQYSNSSDKKKVHTSLPSPSTLLTCLNSPHPPAW